MQTKPSGQVSPPAHPSVQLFVSGEHAAWAVPVAGAGQSASVAQRYSQTMCWPPFHLLVAGS